MKKCSVVLAMILLCGAANAVDMPDWSNVSVSNPFKKDYRTKNAEYLYNVHKQDEKDRYQKQKLERKPSGYMTVEEYELLSVPKDKTLVETEIPQMTKPSDMKYVPQPIYKISRYNNPPGSPELSISKKIYKQRMINEQGITSPDYTMMVYPAVYYYPESAGVACDLFVIPLDKTGTPLDKIKKANVMHRNPNPILSTDKSVKEKYIFRTLTPVDFSFDGTKLLVKEKIGSSEDGIWQTRAIVYDFETKTSYDLSEVRDAISYYWKEHKGLDLEEKRWDIYPLGFQLLSPYRVAVAAYAYTGNAPVFLGTWSIDSKGSGARLISLTNKDVKIAMNGVKLVKDGAVAPDILNIEEKQVKRMEKADAKEAKAKDKSELKEMRDEHNAKMKELRTEFNKDKKEFNYQDKIKGTTSQNDSVEQYQGQKVIRDLQEENKELQKEINRLNRAEKQLEKVNK